MDILFQIGVFLVVFGLGKFFVTRKTKHRLHEVHKERDKALKRLKELHDGQA